MKNTKDAVLRVVKATRLTMNLADALRETLPKETKGSALDLIADDLKDALFQFSGETLAPEQDFTENSTAMQLLANKSLTDADIAGAILWMGVTNDEEMMEQPKPNLMSEDKFQDMFRKNGGYSFRSASEKMDSIRKKLNDIQKKVREVKYELNSYESDIRLVVKEERDCLNELCLKCGEYQKEFTDNPDDPCNCKHCRWFHTKNEVDGR